MITVQHLGVVGDYLRDLREAVTTVKAQPDLANQGGVATYEMMAHIPLRRLVKKQVLDIFAEQYRQGAVQLDLSGPKAGSGQPPVTGPRALLERVARWYVWRASWCEKPFSAFKLLHYL